MTSSRASSPSHRPAVLRRYNQFFPSSGTQLLIEREVPSTELRLKFHQRKRAARRQENISPSPCSFSPSGHTLQRVCRPILHHLHRFHAVFPSPCVNILMKVYYRSHGFS
ncbi:hypothetical protein BaRGS_00000376 [Batillaria attramentaria]|uniref:Uncharacterized protein n=1 Tax=Batillaria attramentaria TaxID=370345 RepID=A0ABD0M9Q8_9CAEN